MRPDPSRLAAAWESLQARLPGLQAEDAILCGSGWSAALGGLSPEARVSYADIPGLGMPGVDGHEGELAYCRPGGRGLLLFKGRRHFYETGDWTPVALPIYLSLRAGVRDLLITNSAGGIHPALRPGDFLLVSDHLNLIGDNPLVGPHDPFWGPRFPDQTHVYSPTAQTRLRDAAARAAVPLLSGVYAATRGPLYETPAEIRAWRTLGADAVGMSTVPEAQLASAAGLHVSALSCITNHAAGLLGQPLHHEEVTRAAAAALPRMSALLLAWLHPSSP